MMMGKLLFHFTRLFDRITGCQLFCIGRGCIIIIIIIWYRCAYIYVNRVRIFRIRITQMRYWALHSLGSEKTTTSAGKSFRNIFYKFRQLRSLCCIAGYQMSNTWFWFSSTSSFCRPICMYLWFFHRWVGCHAFRPGCFPSCASQDAFHIVFRMPLPQVPTLTSCQTRYPE